MNTEFWVYSLYCMEMVEDWTHNVPGTLVETKVLRDKIVVDDCSDNICIGGNDCNGTYRQFDSYEAYYANNYFMSRPEWKLSVECMKVSVNNIEQFKIKE